MSQSVLHLFHAHQPEQVFAYKAGQAVVFAEFLADVERLSQQLLGLDGDVLVSCQSRYAFSVALLSAWKANKVAIPVAHSNQDILDKVQQTFDIALHCDDAWADEHQQESTPVKASGISFSFPASQMAVYLYTSGSTGEPKLIEKTLGSLWYEVESLSSTLDWLDSPIVASVPAYHLYGLTFSVLLPWCLGVPLVDDMPLHAEEVETCFAQSGAHIFITVPIHLKALMGAGVNLKGKQCVVSAAPLPEATAQAFRQHYQADALEVYGSSETGIVAYRKQLDDAAWSCFPQVHCSADENGLLHVSSPFLYEQAEGNPFEKTFASSDKVVLHDESHFTLEGRADAIIKIAGKRISLPSIEQHLMRCQGVRDAAVVAVPAESAVRDWAIWAVIAVDDKEQCNARAIKQELRNWVDGVAIPRRMLCLARLPREANGKLPKKKIMELFTHV